ncbi:MAG: IS3 family transposase [Longimicrobiales bacterium]
MYYSETFKAQMVQKLTRPEGPSATELSKEVGVHQSTLSRWVRQARSVPEAWTETLSIPDEPRRTMPARRPQDWTGEEKYAVVMEAASVADEDLGAWLREKGLHEANLKQWRQEMITGLAKPKARSSSKPSAETRRIRELERELARKEKALAEAAALLILKKKGPSPVGGRGRHHSPEERAQILSLVQEAVEAGAHQEAAAGILGLKARTLQRWRQQNEAGGEDQRQGPLTEPANKLSPAERETVLKTTNTAEYRDLSPAQIVPQLADEGTYLASESTVYRLLRAAKQMAHRQRAKPATSKKPREQVATGPNQVWSWDITYLPGPVRGTFFFLYLFLDVWSRKIVGAQVYAEENAERASQLFVQSCIRQGVEPGGLVLHSDNGGPMKGSTMLATLQWLGVVPSFSRPHVSDDNPYSEALFRTLKYVPKYPNRPFLCLEEAQRWVEAFILWYNTQHRHSAIRFVTPDQRHFGQEKAILANRQQVYEEARSRNPDRWSGSIRDWSPVKEVRLNPQHQPAVKAKTGEAA